MTSKVVAIVMLAIVYSLCCVAVIIFYFLCGVWMGHNGFVAILFSCRKGVCWDLGVPCGVSYGLRWVIVIR